MVELVVLGLAFYRTDPSLLAVNEIEIHPYFTQKKHIKFCHDNNVQIIAYGSLGAPGLSRAKKVPLLADLTIQEIAEKYSKKPSQILLRWAVQCNLAIIPKSIHPERITNNFEIFDFTISREDMERIDALDLNLRSFTQEWMDCPTFC